MDDKSNYDAKLHDCMVTIWTAYRQGSMKDFNDCFAPLYERYKEEPGVQYFIKCMGLGLAGIKNKWTHQEVKK